MRRKSYFIAAFILFVTTSIRAQNQPENAILLFDGGKLDIHFAISSHLLTRSPGLIVGSPSFANSSNPAALAFVTKKFFRLHVDLGGSSRIDVFYDINSRVKTEVDQAIQQYRSPDSEIVYPTVSPEVGLQHGLTSFALVLPMATTWGNSTIMASFSQPLTINVNALGTGFTTLIETCKHVGDQDMIVHMRLLMDMNLSFHTEVAQTQLGFATTFGERWAVGSFLNRYSMSASLNAKFKIDGIMETAGTEFAFNDPYDPRIDFAAGEQNDLNQSVTADFSGNAWGMKIGGLYQLSPCFTAGTTLELNPTLHLAGEMTVVQNKIPALNADALLSDDPDVTLVDPTKLHLDKLTMTESVENPIDNFLDLKLPSSFGLLLAYRTGVFSSSFQWNTYFGEFAYDFLNESRGLKLKQGFDLDLRLKSFNLALGVIFAETIHHNADKEGNATQSLPLPKAILSSQFHLGQGYQLGVQMALAPVPGLHLGMGYSF
ncbi:hypothetical protein DRQ12_05425 [candidate division KSB1 bacterium]|nr:MAG: hypothetical protein DRQ12_05425 [candidate division KSB1 bacterium]